MKFQWNTPNNAHLLCKCQQVKRRGQGLTRAAHIFNVIFNISVEDLHTLFTNAINTRKFEAITHKKRKQKEKNERKAKCFLLLLLWRNNLTSNCAPRVGWLTARRPKKKEPNEPTRPSKLATELPKQPGEQRTTHFHSIFMGAAIQTNIHKAPNGVWEQACVRPSVYG